MVVTLGERGVVLLAKGATDCVHLPCPAVQAVDTTVSLSLQYGDTLRWGLRSLQGAGDAFVGSLAYFLSREKGEGGLESMVERSMQIASLSVTKPGTQASYPRRQDLPSHIAL